MNAVIKIGLFLMLTSLISSAITATALQSNNISFIEEFNAEQDQKMQHLNDIDDTTIQGENIETTEPAFDTRQIQEGFGSILLKNFVYGYNPLGETEKGGIETLILVGLLLFQWVIRTMFYIELFQWIALRIASNAS